MKGNGREGDGSGTDGSEGDGSERDGREGERNMLVQKLCREEEVGFVGMFCWEG